MDPTYKKKAWPVVQITGSSKSGTPYQIVIARPKGTRGRHIFLSVIDWLDATTGHRICGTSWGSRLIDEQFDSEELLQFDITEEQMRDIDPEWMFLPENEDDDE